MALLLTLLVTAASHKLSLPQNEVPARQIPAALVQESDSSESDEGFMGPSVVSNFQDILDRLTRAVGAISATPKEAEQKPQPLPEQIPRRLLFNHKINLLTASDAALDSQSKLLRENVRHIVKLFSDVPASEVHFWDDGDCQRGLERLQMNENEALGLDFAREKVGMVKSDLCRLAMMYELGGFYFDTDILPLAELQRHLEPTATFATVIADGGTSYFQAFLAATPKHPVILESLKEFKAWYDLLNKPGQNQALLKRKTANGNIGTALLRKAYRDWSHHAREDPVVIHKGGHVSQFFVEKNDKSLKGFKGVPRHLSGSLCNYAVVDTRLKTVVMFSRIYDKVHHMHCREEEKFMRG